ncbi:hypothetical protein KGQ64_07525 [bacterium]|nr:hypothetical protein [bacterium]
MEKKKEGVSRQTLWQRKHRAMGLCVVCSEPAYKGWRCVKHYEQHKIVMRLRYIPRVRGRYDVGGSVEFADLAAKRAQVAPGMMGGGPFGPLPIPASAEAAPAVETKAAPKAAARDGRTLATKRNKPRASTKKPVRVSATSRSRKA